MNYKELYKLWSEDVSFDELTRQELLEIKDNQSEIEDRFYKDLEFGTAGLRGVIGAGTNRINDYVVRKATQGLANYIKKQNIKNPAVAIAYDSRRKSPEFGEAAALCLAANGIKAYIFDSLRPTPELSFAVRELNCIAGINITASHNPPEYNGYKVYWSDGAQITPPHDKGIMDEVKAILSYTETLTMAKEEAIKEGLYEVIGSAIDDAYIEALKKQVKNFDSIKNEADNLKIVYSPLHGTGNIPVRRILKEIGFNNVYVVKEQELPDGEFPTVSYPNPEAQEAFILGLKLAKEVKADIVLATDPDADRLGVYVLHKKTGEYVTLTGNMSGCLLAEYELSQIKTQTGIPKNAALIKTIVTTNMADAIAKEYDCELIEVLTGFKYIGQKILEFETNNSGEYLFGFEESYGCLIGTHARDKDAVVATMALCEAAAYYKEQGLDLYEVMMKMYEKYGFYKDDITAITLKGKEGIEKMAKILEDFRMSPPEKIGKYKVLKARDYKEDTIKDMATNEVTTTGLPTSDVLYYDLEDNAWVCVRPSGTEPKIKFYYGVKGNTLEEAEVLSEELGKALLGMME